MNFFSRLIAHLLGNMIALYAASHLIPGFIFTGGKKELAMAALILTLIHMFVKPIVKLMFIPLIILTLGLFLIIINIGTLYILDIVSSSLTIEGYMALLWATLLISAINFILHLTTKNIGKKA
ncbi:hypothetical protein A3A21_00580 [Candidatus Jorgensenbacteria bacterium RIFCSPLOWO2_01_FULL_45_25b]|uniref:Phage holin family protein n=1 Tax=Candidatus Jorgensenbacteria bacterium RIFCSPLOWO2_01_FULL_45_25b TaxID=1798471 RepID=A0A1F6BYT9_9BACT|nr:MAG: hypothetical protein A3A21_00580 [Candidatus Jorgensenbacteria bacterium RIFCSPLOWO2_01_FULL_45_25b]